MNIRDQVMMFHKTAGMKDPEIPTIPHDDVVRLRARLMIEEFMETIQAMFDDTYANGMGGSLIKEAEELLLKIIKESNVDVNMIEFADGLADQNVINEGSFIAFGINSVPVQLEVHNSNMSKFPNGEVKRRADGKIIKPDSWRPPMIEDELRKQGWNG